MLVKPTITHIEISNISKKCFKTAMLRHFWKIPGIGEKYGKQRIHGVCNICDKGSLWSMKMDDANFQCLFYRYLTFQIYRGIPRAHQLLFMYNVLFLAEFNRHLICVTALEDAAHGLWWNSIIMKSINWLKESLTES